MAKIKINGKELEVADGKNLVDAAVENGFPIPHYCYHPGLSIAGQCRMCVVEQEGNPKLQVACNMKCSDGLSVVTDSPKVAQAVQANLEFHLINHPIDCPICDQAGECGLQDYYMKYGKYQSQMREEKVNKEKAVDLGDKVVLDKERCILCSRCVRFTNEISETRELGIYNRGDRSVIGTVDDKPMTGNYQVNTVDICPVGALTSKDFRFEQRVWFLEEMPSVCSGCSRGCNIHVHHKKAKHIYRLKPRYNEKINKWWMCDEGRNTYKDSNYDRRATVAQLRGVEMSTAEAIQLWASDLKTLIAMEQTEEIGVWVTPHETNEDLDALFKVFAKNFQIKKFFSVDAEAIQSTDSPVDGFLFRRDRFPNTAGFLKKVKEHGIRFQGLEQLLEQISKSAITHLILVIPETAPQIQMLQDLALRLNQNLFVSVLSPQIAAAQAFNQSLFIPTLTHYEKTGSVINCDGIEQKINSTIRMFKQCVSLTEAVQHLEEAYKRPSETKTELRV